VRERLPGHHVSDDFGLVIVRPPAFENARVQVDDPELGHALSLVTRAFDLAVGVHDESDRTSTARQRSASSHDEEISRRRRRRLYEVGWRQLDIGW
jgi:hypothetical protein